MDIRKLQYIVKLAEIGHFGRTAKELHIAQPALSQNVKSVERQFHVELFHRTSRGAILTEEGRFLLPQIKELIAHADRLEKSFDEASKGFTAELRVAYNRALPTASKGIFESFSENFKNISLNVMDVSWTHRIHDMVIDDQIDVGVVKLPLDPSWRDVHAVTIGESTIVAAIPAAGHLAQFDKISPNQLQEQKIIIWDRNTSPAYYDQITNYIKNKDVEILSILEPNAEYALQEVKKDNGIFLIDEDRASLLDISGVTFRHFSDPEPIMNYGVIWKTNEYKSLSIKRFESFIRSY